MSSTEFLDGLAKVQYGIHQSAQWEHSVLLLVRPSVGEAAVVHVDEAGRVWAGSTRVAGQIERLRRSAAAITSAEEEDISDLVAAFDPEPDARVDVRQLVGFHAQRAGQGSEAAIALFLVRDAGAQVSMTARWKGGETTFIEEPLGYTDALIADAGGYATEPWLDTRGVKGSLRLSRARSTGEHRRGPSALLRYLRVELPEDVSMIEPFDDWLAQLDAPVQVCAWAWARLAAGLGAAPDFLEEDVAARFVELMGVLASDQADYLPDMEGQDPSGNPLPDIVGAQLGGIWEDLAEADEGSAPTPRLEEFINAAVGTAQMFGRASPRWGLAYDASVGQVAIIGIGRMYDDLPSAVVLLPLVIDLQRLWWLAECVYRKGVVLSGSLAPALPADEMECVRLLCRMAANQPTLAAGAALQRQIPLRADRWMSLTDRSRRAIEELDLPDDPNLVERLADDIITGRHFALDHLAIVEVDDMNVDRIILAPEERADDDATLSVFGLVQHRSGVFAVTCIVADKTVEQSPFRPPQDLIPPALTFAPAFMEQMPSGGGASSLELMMLAAWRDLVVAEVREQQYEMEVIRKAKGKARRSHTVETVRYSPLLNGIDGDGRAAAEVEQVPARLGKVWSAINLLRARYPDAPSGA